MIKTYNETYPATKTFKVTLVRTICVVMNMIPACKSMVSEVPKL